jgi:hypothetical protein
MFPLDDRVQGLLHGSNGPTNRWRRRPSLGRLTPIEFEAIMPTPADQAA